MDELVATVIREGWHNFVWKPVAHFLSSGFVGLLAFYATRIILLRLFGSRTYMRGAFSTSQFSLLFACCFAVFAHMLEDYTLNWF